MMSPLSVVKSLDGAWTIRAVCPVCRRTFCKTLKDDEAAKALSFFSGALDARIQEAFSSWKAEEREQFLKSGMCPECWNEMFDGVLDESCHGTDEDPFVEEDCE